MNKLRFFLKKYDFPIHLFALARVVGFRFVRFWYTAVAKIKLSLMRCRHGKGFVVDGPLVVRALRADQIVFGEHVHINSRFGSNLVGLTGPAAFEVIADGRIVIEDYVGLSSPIISARTEVRIGAHSKLGGNVRIYDHDYHSLSWNDRRTSGLDRANAASRPVSIEKDVFIGTNATILKGVTIGDRAIVGAGSVVSKDVPPDEVWAGNPAQFVKRLEVEK